MFACARDCNGFVTSGSNEKLKMANGLGATGDVNYKQEGSEGELTEHQSDEKKVLDAIVDGAGGRYR